MLGTKYSGGFREVSRFPWKLPLKNDYAIVKVF